MMFVELFFTFFIIGMFTIGGGYAMLSLIQNEIVVQNQWMTNAEFADIVATNKKLPDAPLPEKSVLEKGISLLKQVAAIKKEEPEIWDIATSAISGVIGGFTGGAVALEEPPKDVINFDELE